MSFEALVFWCVVGGLVASMEIVKTSGEVSLFRLVLGLSISLACILKIWFGILGGEFPF